MRVALFHNRYLLRGGEDTVVETTAELLRKAGHDALLFVVDNRDAVAGRFGALRTALRARYSEEVEDLVGAFLAGASADVGHVHNFFPALTPAVHTALRARGVPVVQTLHNYRFACANGLFYREGAPCESCTRLGPWNAVRHGCYRGSRFQTAVWSDFTSHHRRRGTWRDNVDVFATPSEFARGKLASLGLGDIHVVPNAVPDPGEPGLARRGAVYVGRLAAEKGIDLLLDAWREVGDTSLDVIGTGPEEMALRRRARDLPNVRFLGELPRDGVDAVLRRALFAVVPSRWYETFGMAAAEAMAGGAAVVAPTGTAVAELVEPGRNGLLFERGNSRSLADACRALACDPDKAAAMGREGRLLWEETLAPDAALARLVALYEEAAARTARRMPSAMRCGL